MESIKYYVEKIPSIIDLIERGNITLPDLNEYSFVGSGNAFQVARLYSQYFNGHAYLSEEINRIKNKDKVCVISASGGKDSIKVVESFNGPVLLTCNPKAKAKSIAGKTVIIPSLEEPPFYNVTSYAAMIYLINKSNLGIPKRDNNLISLLNSPSIIFISNMEDHPIACMCSLKFREILGSLSISLSINEAYHGWFLRPFTREAIISMNIDFDLKSSYKISGNPLELLSNIYYHIGLVQEKLHIEDFEYTKIIEKREWEI